MTDTTKIQKTKIGFGTPLDVRLKEITLTKVWQIGFMLTIGWGCALPFAMLFVAIGSVLAISIGGGAISGILQGIAGSVN